MASLDFGLYEPKTSAKEISYIKSPNILLQGKMTFDPNGLFSEIIWPHTENTRFVKLAAFDFSQSGIYVHPKVLEQIRIKQRLFYSSIFGLKIKYDEKEKKFVKVTNSNDEGLSGVHLLNEMLSKLNKYKDALNPLIYTIFEKYGKRIFIQSIFILPPALRDVQIVDKQVNSTSEINSLYQKLIKSCNSTRLKANKMLKQNLDSRENMSFTRIQKTIEDIFNFEKTMLGKKEGFIRQDVLAKRVDFSARAVIAPDPKLPIDKVRVPYKVIMKLAEPFIAYHIFSRQENVEKLREISKELITENTFSKFMSKLKNGHGSLQAFEAIKKIIDIHIVGKFPVILKRDPSLHMLSWQAFEFTCTDEDVIFISPLVVGGFNADFDGDQMAVFLPLTVEAQREVREKMKNRFVNPGNGGTETTPSQDGPLGLYILTQKQTGPVSNLKYGDISLDSIKINYQLSFNTMIRYSGRLGNNIKMTYGNYLYNMVFLKVFNEPYLGVVNKKVMKKHVEMARKRLTPSGFLDVTSKLIELAGDIVSLNPITINPDELNLPKNIIDLKNKILDEEDLITSTERLNREVLPRVKEHLKKNDSGLYVMIESGARGGWDDVMQLIVTKGYIADGTGKISKKPIKSSFIEGLDPTEVLQMGSAAVKGTQDRSIGTQQTGRLGRELSFATQDAIISPTKDCGTTNFLKITVEDSATAESLKYRFTKEFGLITDENYSKLIGKTINLRSPVTCKAKDGICEKCYGPYFRTLKTKNVGLVAAQSISERGSQIMMKTFHTGGKAEVSSGGIPHLTDKYPELDELLIQIKQTYKAKDDIIFELDMNSAKVTYSEDSAFVNNGYFTIINPKTGDKTIVNLLEFSINFGIEFIDNGNVEPTSSGYRISYHKDENIGEMIFTQSDMSTTIKYITNLMLGKIYADNYLKLYKALNDAYKTMGVLSIHSEIILSQMMRVADKLELQWRHYQDQDYKIISIRDVPYYQSPELAVGFQNISKALDIALVIDKPKDRKPGPLEKFAYDELEPESKFSDYLK